MPKTVPTPLAAALGLLPAALDGVRRLPGKAVQLPVLAISSALTTVDSTRRGYDDLAVRGQRLVARLRGTSFDELEDRVEDALQGTPLAGPYDAVEDAVEDVAATAGRAVRSLRETAAASAGRSPAKKAAAAVATAKGGATDDAPDAEAPKGEPTPKAPEGELTRVDTAATPEVVAVVEQAAAAATGSPVLAHDELPLADYDHMTLGSLRGRLRSLSVEQLVQVRDYEKAHADRLPVVTMLDNRIAKLATEPATTLAPGGDGAAPELQPSQIGRGGSKVGAASGPATPPVKGNPAKPAQVR